MNSIELKARAKINLSLDIIKKRDDGYHELKMIMQTIALHDTVSLEVTQEGIELSCNCKWIPSGNENIAYKAANLIINKFGIKKGIKIKIQKRIPVAAGLAGGSSDAAAVINGINSLFSLGINQAELMTLGKQIGADVPYCIKGGTMLAEGIGEVLTELSPLPNINILLVKPKIGVSTAWVYRNLDIGKIEHRPDSDTLIKAIRDKDIDTLSKNMKNVLETVTANKYSVINEIKDRLIEAGAIGSMMSGSGPSVFGIFPDYKTAQKAYGMIKSTKWNCYLTKTDN